MNHLNGTPEVDVRDLAAGMALGDLSVDEAALLARIDEAGWRAEEEGLESAVGSLFLAVAGAAPGDAASEAVPNDAVRRLHRLADAYLASAAVVAERGAAKGAERESGGGMRHASAPSRDGPVALIGVSGSGSAERPARGSEGARRVGLALAAAAAVVIAASGWIVAWRQVPGRALVPGEVLREVRILPDAVTLPWSEWSDADVRAEFSGVTGEVVWSDEAQRGVMRLANLPDVPGAVYQLWIIDAERGMSQRVSGAIFSGGRKETFITIEPRLRIGSAAAFAVTIEKQGGTWVSDMSRRVVIAARPG